MENKSLLQQMADSFDEAKELKQEILSYKVIEDQIKLLEETVLELKNDINFFLSLEDYIWDTDTQEEFSKIKYKYLK